MTQALNLANFANKLNSSGQTDNSGLQNSSVTVTAGTGMSGGGVVALGSSVTLNNAGVTSVAAGTGISVSGSTGAVTISATGTGTVTSVATGNGLSGGTITSSGTLTIACPSWGSVGSYATGAGTSIGSWVYPAWNNPDLLATNQNYSAAAAGLTGASGTWKCMGQSGVSYSYYDQQVGDNRVMGIGAYQYFYIFCRVS